MDTWRLTPLLDLIVMELITHMNIYLKIKFIENGIIFTNNRKLIINNLPSRNSNNLNNPDIKKPGKQMQMRFSDDLR